MTASMAGSTGNTGNGGNNHARWQWALAHVDLVYLQRMRHHSDRHQVVALCASIFDGVAPVTRDYPQVDLSDNVVSIGHAMLARGSTGMTNVTTVTNVTNVTAASVALPHALSRPLSHMMTCVGHDWPCLLVSRFRFFGFVLVLFCFFWFCFVFFGFVLFFFWFVLPYV